MKRSELKIGIVVKEKKPPKGFSSLITAKVLYIHEDGYVELERMDITSDNKYDLLWSIHDEKEYKDWEVVK